MDNGQYGQYGQCLSAKALTHNSEALHPYLIHIVHIVHIVHPRLSAKISKPPSFKMESISRWRLAKSDCGVAKRMQVL